MSWPYENGQPVRCARCGCAPAIRLADRAPGPWCAEHLPWRPVLPSWGVGKCIRCPGKGARVVSPSGRSSGPWCGRHVPDGVPFSAAADELLAILAGQALDYRPRRKAVA